MTHSESWWNDRVVERASGALETICLNSGSSMGGKILRAWTDRGYVALPTPSRLQPEGYDPE